MLNIISGYIILLLWLISTGTSSLLLRLTWAADSRWWSDKSRWRCICDWHRLCHCHHVCLTHTHCNGYCACVQMFEWNNSETINTKSHGYWVRANVWMHGMIVKINSLAPVDRNYYLLTFLFVTRTYQCLLFLYLHSTLTQIFYIAQCSSCHFMLV